MIFEYLKRGLAIYQAYLKYLFSKMVKARREVSFCKEASSKVFLSRKVAKTLRSKFKIISYLRLSVFARIL